MPSSILTFAGICPFGLICVNNVSKVRAHPGSRVVQMHRADHRDRAVAGPDAVVRIGPADRVVLQGTGRESHRRDVALERLERLRVRSLNSSMSSSVSPSTCSSSKIRRIAGSIRSGTSSSK